MLLGRSIMVAIAAIDKYIICLRALGCVLYIAAILDDGYIRRAQEYVMRGSTSPNRFSGCTACASFLANAFGVSGACDAADRFYD